MATYKEIIKRLEMDLEGAQAKIALWSSKIGTRPGLSDWDEDCQDIVDREKANEERILEEIKDYRKSLEESEKRTSRRASTKDRFGFEDSHIVTDEVGHFWRVLWAGYTKREEWAAKVVPARSNSTWTRNGFVGGDEAAWRPCEGLSFFANEVEWARQERNRKARERRASR